MLKTVYPPPLVVDLWLRQSASVFLTGIYYKLNTHKNFIGLYNVNHGHIREHNNSVERHGPVVSNPSEQYSDYTITRITLLVKIESDAYIIV